MDVKKKLKEGENTELWCNFCDRMFSNRKEIDDGIYEACEPVSSKCTSKNEARKTK